MTKPDFGSMTKTELRTYIITHPDDKAAFHVFVDRYTVEAPPGTYDVPKSRAEVEEIEQLIKQKLSNSTTG